MAASAIINVRTDIQTKEQAEALFKDFGLSMSSAINVFLKQVIKEKRIPFDIGYSIPNDLTSKTMKEAEEGKNLSETFSSTEDLMESLHA